jgi:ankyrin repeat protein
MWTSVKLGWLLVMVTLTSHVLNEAVHAGRSDICQLILTSGRLPDEAIERISNNTIAFACLNGQLSVVQLFVSRCHPSTRHLYAALTNACALGHIKIVTWLLSEMKLSHDERVRWLMATASARGDINTVRLLALQAGLTATEATSQALRVACYNGSGNVVNWLTMYTTADASLCGELGVSMGSMTSLDAACYLGNADIVVTLLQNVPPHAVNIQCGRYDDSALHSIICYNKSKHWIHSLHVACFRANIDE